MMISTVVGIGGDVFGQTCAGLGALGEEAGVLEVLVAEDLGGEEDVENGLAVAVLRSWKRRPKGDVTEEGDLRDALGFLVDDEAADDDG